MRRGVLIISVIICIVLFCSCSSNTVQEASTTSKMSDTEFYYKYFDGDTTTNEKEEGTRISSYGVLPTTIKYNGKEIRLIDVSVCETILEYEYYPYVIITLDISSLTDAERNWLRKEDLEVSAGMKEGKNELKGDSLYRLGSLYYTDTKELVIVFRFSDFHDSYRYSFAGTYFNINIRVTQEEKYDYKSSSGETRKRNKVNELHYAFIAPEEIPLADDFIKEPLKTHVSDWLKEDAEFWANMMK